MRIFRKLYDWVLSWADTPYGAPALFLLALVEASVFPIPPDPLLMALSLSKPSKAIRLAINCTIGSVIGGCIGYLIGWGVWDSLGPYFYAHVPGFSPEKFEQVQSLFALYGFWTIFAAGFTPIPFKIFTIAAGVFTINPLIFIVASLFSRGLRFHILAGLIWRYGAPIKGFIDRYFNLLTYLTLLLMVIALIIWKVLA
jgi:membrane protein YqaA with SNARE-associated domain